MIARATLSVNEVVEDLGTFEEAAEVFRLVKERKPPVGLLRLETPLKRGVLVEFYDVAFERVKFRHQVYDVGAR